MTIPTDFSRGRSALTVLCLAASMISSGCSDEPPVPTETVSVEPETSTQETDSGAAEASPPVIEVATTEYAIEMPDAMTTGWNTFDFHNRGDQTHFVLMYRLAEGKDIEDQLAHVVPAFGPLMDGLRSGELTKEDIGPFLTEHVPEWGLQMTYVGGAGLLAPGRSTRSTFFIDQPGTYLVECYVKAPNGAWHTSMGMLHQVTVEEGAGNDPPSADTVIEVNAAGVDAPEVISAGRHTFRVNLDAQAPGFMPFDLNLARLAADTDLDALIFWMDWSNVGGLRAPSPVEFLGGVEHMPAGSHGFMTVDLEPGDYLWISEINAASHHAKFRVE